MIDREVGVGRKRIDLVVRWPFTGAGGKRAVQRAAMERTRFEQARTPSGRQVTSLRA